MICVSPGFNYPSLMKYASLYAIQETSELQVWKGAIIY